jgi:hypothetical protein
MQDGRANTMSEFPSGNALRDAGLIAVIEEAQASGEPITPANISLNCRQKFNPSFVEVTATELAEAVASLAAREAEPEAQPDTVVERQHLDEQPEPPTMTRAEAEQMVKDAQRNLFDVRRELADKVTAQKAARGALAAAVMSWQRGGAPQQTREEMQREHIATEQARKLAGLSINGRASGPGGPSAYDMSRAGANGRSVNRRYSPTRRGLLPGQRAFSLTDSIARSGSGRVDMKGNAAVPRPKLPSER